MILRLHARPTGRFGTRRSALPFRPNRGREEYLRSTGIRPTTVYLRPFPLTGAVYQVSKNDDGHHPWWSRDGRELFYVPGPDGLVRVKVNRSPVVSFSNPSALPRNGFFESPVSSRGIDLSPDGERLLACDHGRYRHGRSCRSC
jgi:hypothetical protein